jgi:hypothetical protein
MRCASRLPSELPSLLLLPAPPPSHHPAEDLTRSDSLLLIDPGFGLVTIAKFLIALAMAVRQPTPVAPGGGHITDPRSCNTRGADSDPFEMICPTPALL